MCGQKKLFTSSLTVLVLPGNVMLIDVSNYRGEVDIRRHTQMFGKPVLDSGNYRHGFFVTPRKLVRAGTYTLVASTYYHGKQGSFAVKIASSQQSALVVEEVR